MFVLILLTELYTKVFILNNIERLFKFLIRTIKKNTRLLLKTIRLFEKSYHLKTYCYYFHRNVIFALNYTLVY